MRSPDIWGDEWCVFRATHLPAYITSKAGLDLYDGALLLTVAGLFTMGGKVVFGWMMDNLSARVNGLLSFFIAPATCWVLISGFIVDSFATFVAAFQVWFVCFIMAGMVSLGVRLPNREDAVA